MIKDRLFHWLGRKLATFLSQPVRRYRTFAVSGPGRLEAVLEPGDVLLVEGDQRVSTAIKYLTQSTWSHAAVYVGRALSDPTTGEPRLIEADINHGVVSVPLSKYGRFNTRICRAVNLTDEDRGKVIEFMTARLGHQYDLKNVVDLARYLIVKPPVPAHWRRRMLALGSGDPTRAICSTLIAQAFQSVRYPILPHVSQAPADAPDGRAAREILHIRHHSLFAPRDFDLSPYFQVIKPTLAAGFDYKTVLWDDQAGEE
jgi:hypothetical protein